MQAVIIAISLALCTTVNSRVATITLPRTNTIATMSQEKDLLQLKDSLGNFLMYAELKKTK